MKMKKLLITLFLLSLIFLNINCNFSLALEDDSKEPSPSAISAILLDNRTNKVLYKKEENKKMYPASTTKILTAILVLENCNLNDVVTSSYNAIMSVPEGYSIAKIQIGEQLTVEQLLELLLVYSANDAANVLAEYVGGSTDSFVAMMNTKINELGLTDSHFTNPYGLHDENHYTTAHDLAVIMQYCLKNENFRKIAGQASCAIPATNLYGPRSFDSTNELLIPGNPYYYKYLTTGKTGFTSPAKECLVSSAYRDDLELICVVLGSDNRFFDTRTIYEYGYENYSIKNIANENDVITNIKVSNATKNTKNLDLLICEPIYALVKNSDFDNEIIPEIILNKNISAPIEEGAILGKVKYTINGVTYTTDLIAAHAVESIQFLDLALYAGSALILSLFGYEIFLVVKSSRRKDK